MWSTKPIITISFFYVCCLRWKGTGFWIILLRLMLIFAVNFKSFSMNWYLFTLFYGPILLFQAGLFNLIVISLHNIHVTLELFKSLKATSKNKGLLMCISRSLSHKPLKERFSSTCTLKLWNDLTIKSNDLTWTMTWNNPTMERSDRKTLILLFSMFNQQREYIYCDIFGQ